MTAFATISLNAIVSPLTLEYAKEIKSVQKNSLI
jgi:hypothetical protein